MRKYYIAIIGVFALFFSLGNIDTFAQTIFKDVNNQYWAKGQINYLAEKNIIGGYPDGTFKPNDQLTRAQAAKMLVKALKLQTDNRPEPAFKDIPKGHQAYTAIATIADEGLMGGTNGLFRPDETLTRAQMAAILTKAFELEEGSTYTLFKDVTKKHWAQENIHLISSNRISMGYSDGTFRPNNPTTRAQFSVFLAVTLYPELFQPKDREKVTREANGNVTSYGSWIYYTSTSQDGTTALFREKMDGSQKIKLTSASAIYTFEIENGYIYYSTLNGLTKMELNGQNKQNIKLPTSIYYFEVEGDLLYTSDSGDCGWNGDDYVEGVDRKRMNLKTMELTVIDSCVRSSLNTFITEKGIYNWEGFYPVNSNQPQKVNLINKSLISDKFQYYRIINVIADRGDLYYLVWGSYSNSGLTKSYLFKYNEETSKITLINEIPKVYGSDLYLKNIYNGHAYFSVDFFGKENARIYRVPITGGKLEFIDTYPKSHSYSLIGGKIIYHTRGILLDRVPLPN